MEFILTILAIALAYDIVLNDAYSSKTIIETIVNIFKSKKEPNTTELIKTLSDEIDELYHDLSYEHSHIQEEIIKQQIQTKEKIIKNLLDQNK